jgi:hypothetical protein
MAYFFLLVYGVSFGHQIIPHHHHEAIANHEHLAVNQHNHCHSEKESHNHVEHNDHFDDGIIDYLGCVLGGHEHNPSSECELLLGLTDQKSNTKTQNSTVDNIVNSVTIVAVNLLPKKEDNNFTNVEIPLNTLAENKAKRGPPMA